MRKLARAHRPHAADMQLADDGAIAETTAKKLMV